MRACALLLVLAHSQMRMRPVEDAAGREARRQAPGLPAIAEYRRMLEDAYGQPVD